MCGGVVVYMYMCEGGLFGSLLAGNLPNIVNEVSLISLKGWLGTFVVSVVILNIRLRHYR